MPPIVAALGIAAPVSFFLGILTWRGGYLARWSEPIRRVTAEIAGDLWAGLRAPCRALAGPPPQPSRRLARDPRQGLDPADPKNAELLDSCPVCGIHDPERFRLHVRMAKWQGWPAHEYCVLWLAGPGAEPPAPGEPASTDAPAAKACPAEWSVLPGGGMSVYVASTDGLTSRAAHFTLNPADAHHARADLICWQPSISDDLIVLHGKPALPALAVPLPADAEVIAWIGIPARCTQITPPMIRCALPAELPGLS